MVKALRLLVRDEAEALLLSRTLQLLIMSVDLALGAEVLRTELTFVRIGAGEGGENILAQLDSMFAVERFEDRDNINLTKLRVRYLYLFYKLFIRVK